MLNDFIKRKRVRLNGIVGFFPAAADGDDIEVYTDDDAGRTAPPRAKFFGLRQQAEKEGGDPYMCVSDFVAPRESGVKDYIGMFACSAGHGLEEVVEEYKQAGDDYRWGGAGWGRQRGLVVSLFEGSQMQQGGA
jgi:5-methyltetrahydrofolate--homocysteine methyltransferase